MAAFGLLACGLLFGVVLALLAFAAYLLYHQASLALDHTQSSEKTLLAAITRNTLQAERLESSVTAALTKVDASEMREASLLIQRTQRQFARTTDQFMKLLYSQEGAAAIAAEEARAAGGPDRSDPNYFDPSAYSTHLKQRAQEASRAEDLSQLAARPPLDPDEAWRMDEEEAEAGGPLA